jgi:hypothetical protein
MANLDALRKLIREEVRAVFQEELSGILKEAIMHKGNPQTITETTKPTKAKIPGTLNTQPFRPVAAPNLGVGNPLNSILAETAQSMTDRDMESFGMSGAPVKEAMVVESVDDMFANARKSSNMEAIEINAVPDFTGLMAKMKANGEI